MELFVGFILGVVASMIASILLNSIPSYRQRTLSTLLKNPRLFCKLYYNNHHKKINELFYNLYKSWEEKDLDKYISCWSSNAVRLIGTNNNIVDGLIEIKDAFIKSIARYRDIKVMSYVIEEIDIRKSEPIEATVEIHYRFQLIRMNDLLPVFEEATEYYILIQKKDGYWKIASNMDHSKDVSK